MKETIFFDLDGTLLKLDQTEFTNRYFYLLGQYMIPYGFEPEQLMKDVWKGTYAMVKNDGSMTNEARFWQVFTGLTGRGNPEDQESFLEFYKTDFCIAKDVTAPVEGVKELIAELKAKGYELVLATNPLFPRIATLNRIGWADLSPTDFRMITTYEMMNTCKPNPEYYREICRKLDLDPSHCRMVGNDAVEDTAAEAAGIRTFLITDCLENAPEGELSVPHGSWNELRNWLGL